MAWRTRPYAAWGARQESWLLDHGELVGQTEFDPVWRELGDLIEAPIGRMNIRQVFVDSGLRPGKRFNLPVHQVYEFARNRRGTVFATKGYASRAIPLSYMERTL